MGKRFKLLLLAFVVFALGQTTWAETITIDPSLQDVTEGNTRTLKDPLQQDGEGYYLLGSVQDWIDFAALVNGGTTNANARMTADIDLGNDQTMIGTDSRRYSGTFDGNHHTININISNSATYTAPFSYISNATIKNIKIEGSVSGNMHCAGLVGTSFETSYISNVTVNATITTSGSHCGGILGHGQNSHTTMDGCVFSGSINGRGSGSTVGVICGWNHGGLTTINNCIELGSSYTNCSTFNPIFCGSSVSVNSSYYLTPKNSGTSYGTQLTSSAPEGEVFKQIVLAGNTIAIPVTVSNIDPVYYSNEGASPEPVVSFLGTILTNGTDYSLSYSNNTSIGDASVTISGLDNFSGLKIVNFRIAGIALSGEGTAASPFLISSDDDWTSFVTSVNDFNFNGKYLKLTNDINIESFVGIRDDHPFSGIFNGNGHTITTNIVSTATGSGLSQETLNDVGVAPFHFIDGATIKNLKIAGTISARSNHASGLVGIAYGTNFISNCVVNATIITTADYVGGIIGHGYASATTVQDCLFNGRIEGGSKTGVIWGHNHGGTGFITNCLENGTYTNSVNPIYRTEGGTINCTNNYYVTGSGSGGTYVSAEALSDGTISTALQAGRSETIWVQDPVLNQPMLKIFANYVNHVTGYGDSEKSDHWVFIASPVAGNLLPTAVENLVAATATNYDLYRFNQSGANGEWENYKAHTDGFVLENGKGYLYANKNDADLTFAGVLNMSASMDVALDYDENARLAGFNLVGNPFTEAAYIDRTYFKMNDDGSDIVPVDNYNEEAIPALTGVIVEATDEGQHVTFTKAGAKSRGNSDSQGSLQMTLTKSGVRGNAFHDKAIISFNESAQLGKYIFNENHAKLYIPQDGNDYAIAFSNHQGEVPVHFVAKETGKYTISVETHGRASLQGVKLIDKFENVVIDLGIDDSYTFIGTPADSRDRFIIRFENSENFESSDFAYQNGSDIIISGNGELQVFDVMGRLVSQQYVNGIEIIAKPSQTGVYIMKLNGKTQKIVVR